MPTPRTGRPRGRPRKYSLDLLEVGQSTTIEWKTDLFGRRLRDQNALRAAILMDEKRSGRKYHRTPMPGGLLVTRLA